MIGILYKDFVSVKGKILSIALITQFLLITALRFIKKNNSEMDNLIYILYILFLAVSFGCLLFSLEPNLFKHEKTGKIKRYYISMPISKKEYVFEKYVFMAIAICFVILLFYIEGEVCSSFCAKISENNNGLIDVASSIKTIHNQLPLFAGIILFICGIEFLFIFILGFDKGNQIKTGIVCVLFVLFIIYLLFGNLALMEKWDLPHIISYIQSHSKFNLMLSIIVVSIGMLVYFISYLISSKSFEKREDIYDE